VSRNAAVSPTTQSIAAHVVTCTMTPSKAIEDTLPTVTQLKICGLHLSPSITCSPQMLTGSYGAQSILPHRVRSVQTCSRAFVLVSIGVFCAKNVLTLSYVFNRFDELP